MASYWLLLNLENSHCHSLNFDATQLATPPFLVPLSTKFSNKTHSLDPPSAELSVQVLEFLDA